MSKSQSEVEREMAYVNWSESCQTAGPVEISQADTADIKFHHRFCRRPRNHTPAEPHASGFGDGYMEWSGDWAVNGNAS
jgi:hypothetical protein